MRDESRVLAALIKPGNLRYLGSSVRKKVRHLLMRNLLPSDADVKYHPKLLDDYLAGDHDAIWEDASVLWGCTPTVPVCMFHGADDVVVPIEASLSALETLQDAGGAPVTLRECSQTESTGHLDCVPEYLSFALQVLAQSAILD